MNYTIKITLVTSSGTALCLFLLCFRSAWGVALNNYVLPVVDEVGLPPLFFLCWNLFLALIPVALALWMQRLHRWWFWLIGTLWLLFLPNAPYLLTDLIHLRHRPPVPIWYDALLFSSFAFMGLMAGAYALALVTHRIGQLTRPVVAKVLGISIIGLSGFDVYLGRIFRWNSWDVFIRPLDLFGDPFDLLQHKGGLEQASVFSFCISALFLLAFYIVSPFQNNLR